MKLKPTRLDQRRHFNHTCAAGTLADGTGFIIGAENDVHGGVTINVGNNGQAYLLPYGAILKAVEEARRGK